MLRIFLRYAYIYSAYSKINNIYSGNQINERRIDDNRRHDISEATRSYFTSSTGNRYDDRPSEYAPRTDP